MARINARREAEKLKRNGGMGISTPSSLQGSYNRIGAIA